ncbi:hypothetical protein [Myxococcus sp. Y35]|uniref:hypothetical protein n=1 Tax=Pseudomyxococcus flavus TaxID=3115648 RepID=UPI003CEA2C21
MAEADVELKVKPVERTAEALVLSYEVHNRGAHALWLVDGLYDEGPTGRRQLAPDKAYVELGGSHVVVARMLLPVPENMLVEAPEVPAVSRVDAGQTARRRVVLPLPLTAASPYGTEPAETLPLEAVRELRLRVGYVLDSPELRRHGAQEARGTVYETTEYGQTLKAQRVLESAPLPLPAAAAK